MQPYIHKVRYYETDKMGVAHHANYIHWMEEARIEFLRLHRAFPELHALLTGLAEQNGNTAP